MGGQKFKISVPERAMLGLRGSFTQNLDKVSDKDFETLGQAPALLPCLSDKTPSEA
jgi:hypothetical protein